MIHVTEGKQQKDKKNTCKNRVRTQKALGDDCDSAVILSRFCFKVWLNT